MTSLIECRLIASKKDITRLAKVLKDNGISGKIYTCHNDKGKYRIYFAIKSTLLTKIIDKLTI